MGSDVLSSRWVLMVSLPFEDAVGSLWYYIDRTFIQEVLYLSVTKTHKSVYIFCNWWQTNSSFCSIYT